MARLDGVARETTCDEDLTFEQQSSERPPARPWRRTGRSPNNAPNLGNRQDNRQRGNASQLHEKYKALARDTQLAGDRVQTEYYLQFADHYFRILNESRARFEEQRRQRDDYMSDEDEGEDEAVSAARGSRRRALRSAQRPGRARAAPGS